MEQATLQHAEQAAAGTGFIELDPFSLDAVTSSKAKEFPPQAIIIYGPPGIGKTTCAATFERPFLMRFEDGAAALDVPTFPKLIQSLSEFDQAYKALRGKHNYKTLILDSLDWFEPVVWQYVCQQGQKESIEDFGYGKGYVKVAETWRRIQAKLDALRKLRGMNIVTIAHAVPVTIDPPDSDPYQKYSLKLNKHGASVWMEWADMILFINYKTNLIKAEDGKKSKAKGSGERVIYTAERPAYHAKSRWPLDEEIHIGNDPTWAAFHENLKEATQGAYSHD